MSVLKKGSNETTVGKTTIGGGISIVLVSLANYFGADIGAETAATLTAGLTVILNYYLPAKKR
jgi:hypothetical protein